jgi:hypothetical protein
MTLGVQHVRLVQGPDPISRNISLRLVSVALPRQFLLGWRRIQVSGLSDQLLREPEAKSEARMLKIGYRSSSVTGLDVISETM